MPKSRSQKNEEVAALASALKEAKSVAFSDFQGMTVSSITDLRKKMFTEGVRYVVAKKTLLTVAAKEAGFDVDFKSFPGMIGAAIGTEDEMAPAKLTGEASKDTTIKLVGGIFDGQIVDKEYVTTLSKLPSRSQLLGQLLSVLNGPAGAFVRLLNAYKEEQEKGSPAPAPAAPVAEAPAEPATEAPAAEVAPETAPEAAPEAAPAEAPVEVAPEAPAEPAPEAPAAE
ncbi:MAG TPA: 50S ribosomal protein L10 [bacterium]|nr:50S ribosomal protein L10 [Candidatus Magasanikbacteria bacterium]USN52208.1 MAG: 50S ribosomal protein L10 [Candidatus Nomurabacteria bacterium]HPF95082.1 50S ribosomal protein L10 [bacterium]